MHLPKPTKLQLRELIFDSLIQIHDCIFSTSKATLDFLSHITASKICEKIATVSANNTLEVLNATTQINYELAELLLDAHDSHLVATFLH